MSKRTPVSPLKVVNGRERVKKPWGSWGSLPDMACYAGRISVCDYYLWSILNYQNEQINQSIQQSSFSILT